MQKGKPKSDESNILVVIRVRPLNAKEELNGEFEITRVQDNLIIVLDPVEVEFEAENKKMLEVYHRSKEQRYTFDRVFKDESHQQIYELTCQPLIRTALSGCNATVFVYGPTGAGKTYTMLGSQEVLGLSVLTVRDMFNTITKDQDSNYDIIITYVEIYNQAIRDLLVPSNNYLELRDDPEKGIVMAGVTEFRAESTEQVMNLLLTGNKRRTTEATNANQTSSRSHAVFQISINKKPRARGPEFETHLGKLSLIDLAGSQRGTVTENRGLRLMEGAKINRSLLALANCINALGDKSKKGYFVPYRDSKLTRLLKDSLGGNCRTVMIANVSPASTQFEQTINTLKYANRAKNIKTKQVPNKKLVHLHISQYKNIINDLRSEIESLKMRLHERAVDDQPIQQIKPPRKGDRSETCSCGRAEDSEEMKKIQADIFQNFQERIQLRRALMEVQQQNALNMLEMKRKGAEVMAWRKVHGEEEPPGDIRGLMRQVSTLSANSKKNILKKEVMNLQLMQNITNTKKIKDQIPRRIKYKDKRDFLELLIKNHILELQNIELEINISIQEKSISDLKSIIQSQRKIITDNGLDTFEEQINVDDEFDLPNFETEDMEEQSDDPDDDFEDEPRPDIAFEKPDTRHWVRQKSASNIKGKAKPIDDEDSEGEEKATKREEKKGKVEISVSGMQMLKPFKPKDKEKEKQERDREAREKAEREKADKERLQKDRQLFSDFNLKGIPVGKRERSKRK